MLKVNELLDRTSKTVSSIAAISLCLAVITVSSVVIKENLKDLLSLRKIKARIICVKSSDEPSVEHVEKETQKTTCKKGGSKKDVSKPTEPVSGDSKASEPIIEAK